MPGALPDTGVLSGSLCTELRIFRLRPAEQGGTSCPQRHRQVAPPASEVPLWGSETRGVILTEGAVSTQPAKEAEAQDLLLLTDPRSEGA